MNRHTVEVFHALMKKGWIDRQDDSTIWSYTQDAEVQQELEDFKQVMEFDLLRASDRLYMIPTQANDLFLKNNWDFRRDIRGDSTLRTRDLYLLNYLSIYLIYLFFSGEGNDPLCREFISKQNFIHQFTQHCKMTEQATLDGEEKDYSENFQQLASVWLSKVDGEPDSQKLDQRYGLLNRILGKYKKDDLFVVGDDDLIRPTRKMKDLMPYFLRKDRVAEIQSWIREEENHAENQ